MASKKTLKIREKRAKRIRGKITGTQEKPRLSVFRSDKHIYVQAIKHFTDSLKVLVCEYFSRRHQACLVIIIKRYQHRH